MAEGKKANWMWRLIGGLLLVILGILVIVYPDISVEIFVIIFGIFMLIEGFLQAVFGLTAPEAKSVKWLFILSGVLSIIIGILAILTPYYVLVAGWILIAAWAIVWGIFEIIAALMTPAEAVPKVYGSGGKWLAVVFGLLAIVLGIVFIIYPESSLTAVVWIAGFIAIVLGLLVMFGSFQLRKAKA